MKEKRLFWALGSLVSAFSVYFYLALNQAISDWFQQTFVVWTMDPPGVPEINLNFFIFNLVNFFGVAFIGLTLWLSAGFFTKKLKSLWLAVATQFILIIGFLLIPAKLNFSLKIGNYDVIGTISYFFRNTLFSYINLSMVISAILLISLYFKHRKEKISWVDTFNSPFAILLAAAFGVLSLFHNFNPDYSQMIWPIFGLVLITLIRLSSSETFDIFKGKTFQVFAIGLLFASHATFLYHATSQVVPYKTQMLSGLYGNSQNRVQNLDASLKIISEGVTQGKMLMVCQSGLLSTNAIGFLGSDKWTWNQQPSEMISGRLHNLQVGSTILACQLNAEDSTRIQSLLADRYIEALNTNANFTLYRVVKSIL